MTSPGLDPRARPIAAACVRSVRPRHRYAARQLSLLQSEGVPRSATALSQDRPALWQPPRQLSLL
jgi:hypothetical protein